MASEATSAGGLRLKDSLWKDLWVLADKDNRKLNEYIAIVLEDHRNKNVSKLGSKSQKKKK